MQQVDAALASPRVERRERLARSGVVALEADARGEARRPGSRPGRWPSELERLVDLAAAVQQAARARTAASARAGSSSSARRSDASSPASTSASASDGTRPSKKRSTARRRLGADELVDDAAVLERLDRRDALDPEGLREALVGVGVELGEHDLALARVRPPARASGVELAARAAPLGPEVDDDGHRRWSARGPRCSKSCSVTSMTAMPSMIRTTPMRASARSHDDEAATGIPVVLLHGLTATHRYVVMGSQGAASAPATASIAYDARGHGASDPAPRPTPTATTTSPPTCWPSSTSAGIERAVLAGASMGAHTALRFALEHPERVAGPGRRSRRPTTRRATTRATSRAGTRWRAGLRERRGRGLRRGLRRPAACPRPGGRP